jgi:hypothetical protein
MDGDQKYSIKGKTNNLQQVLNPSQTNWDNLNNEASRYLRIGKKEYLIDK